MIDHLVSAEWMNKLMPHVGDETLAYASMPRTKARSLLKFKRRICVENMAKHPALTSAYGTILTRYQTLDGHVCAGLAAEVARKKLGQVLEEAERHLGSSGWTHSAGSDISAADVALAVLLAKAHRLGLHKEYFRRGQRCMNTGGSGGRARASGERLDSLPMLAPEQQQWGHPLLSKPGSLFPSGHEWCLGWQHTCNLLLL